MYVSVKLRNVNLRSCSECQFALMPRQDIEYVCYTTISSHTGRFLATEDWEDSVAGPLQCTYLWSQVHKQVLECSQRLAT